MEIKCCTNYFKNASHEVLILFRGFFLISLFYLNLSRKSVVIKICPFVGGLDHQCFEKRENKQKKTKHSTIMDFKIITLFSTNNSSNNIMSYVVTFIIIVIEPLLCEIWCNISPMQQGAISQKVIWLLMPTERVKL